MKAVPPGGGEGRDYFPTPEYRSGATQLLTCGKKKDDKRETSRWTRLFQVKLRPGMSWDHFTGIRSSVPLSRIEIREFHRATSEMRQFGPDFQDFAPKGVATHQPRATPGEPVQK